ncbi:transposase, partial [Escherichia coli O104:H4 str. E92/11]
PNEVKTFDNQRNATQACHMGSHRSVPTDSTAAASDNTTRMAG